MKEPRMPVIDHLAELVRRFKLWLLSFVFGSSIGYLLRSQIITILLRPINRPVYYTSPAGEVEIIFNISFLFGGLLSLPILIYHVIKYVQPASKRISEINFLKVFTYSSILAFLGLAIAYFLVIPAALNFFSSFGGTQIDALITYQEYFDFISKYLVSFAILFQLPLILTFLSTLFPITRRMLIGKIKYVILFSLVLAAILTPTPDIVNQLIMTAPIILLYLISILFVNTKHV